MDEGDVVEILRSGFHTVLVVAGPALAAAMITGLVISILQTLTQVQEMTLANVPKIFITLIVIMLFLPLSFSALRAFMEQITQMIVGV
ncbi:MAG TPA: flagellar biosynthetic protein FliQ [Rhodopila sp.]|nr:flagellar biosynthetic protein FliQ [Rhodopila sp.]